MNAPAHACKQLANNLRSLPRQNPRHEEDQHPSRLQSLQELEELCDCLPIHGRFSGTHALLIKEA
jgi:hypothetical protein